MNQGELLEIKGLKTHFYIPEGAVRAVDGVSFQISWGKTVGLLGESGCGKSVTALSIMRLIKFPPGKILDGVIRFQGQDILSISPKKMRQIRGNEISMIFQEPMTSLNPAYTIGNQISEVFIIHQGLSRKDAVQRSVEILRMVRIPDPGRRAHEYPHQLSGGMRQRVMIAMALACNPKILIADEPTTALDVTIQAQILDLMLELQEQLGMAILLITHDLGVIAEMSDYVVVMYAGEVVESAPLEVIFANPKHPYTSGLMRSIPKLGEKFRKGKQPLEEIKGNVPDLIHLPPGCSFAPRCSSAIERCRKERPPHFLLAADHGCKCWLVEQEAMRIDRLTSKQTSHL